jgi:hypothetical protein
LFTDADRVTITEKDGIQSFEATFDLTKEQRTGKRPPWWKRMLG